MEFGHLPRLAGAFYVEGYLLGGEPLRIPRGLPIEHAWLELPDGTICDPRYPKGEHYVALVRYTREEFSAALDRANDYLPVTPPRVRWNWLCAFYAARLKGIAPEEAAAEATKDPEGGAEKYRAMFPTKAKGRKSR